MKVNKFYKLIIWAILLLNCSLIYSCKNNKFTKSADANYYSNKSYTNLLLDSITINEYFKTLSNSDSNQIEIKEFYKSRDYQFAWFNKEGMVDAASVFYNQLQNYSTDFDNHLFQNEVLDSLFYLVQNDEKDFLKNTDNVNKLELLLTSTFFKYAQRVYGGITKAPKDLEWYIPRKKKDYKKLLDSLVLASNGQVIQEPVNQFYINLKDKLRQYRKIQTTGGLPRINDSIKLLKYYDNDSEIHVVKQSLMLTGDLLTDNKNIRFDESLVNAIKHFQNRMGLKVSGKLDSKTVATMNISIDARIEQIMVNMERSRWMPAKMENDYLWINIPEYKLHVYENGSTDWSMNVVVGKQTTKTSIFRGSISEVVLNPYWNVPASIVNNDVLLHLKKNVSYIRKNNMEIRSGSTVINPYKINWHQYQYAIPYTVRQKPGNNNSLGKIKFLFPNSFNIYLHDTPSKELFGETKRAFSHGCIRIEEPLKLAYYLTKDNKFWSNNRIDSVLVNDKETSISMGHKMPVYIAYFTAWVSNDGQLNFRNDVYNMDDKLWKEIFSE